MVSVSSNLEVSEMDSLLPFSIGDEMERFVLSVTLRSAAASSSAKTLWFFKRVPIAAKCTEILQFVFFNP